MSRKYFIRGILWLLKKIIFAVFPGRNCVCRDVACNVSTTSHLRAGTQQFQKTSQTMKKFIDTYRVDSARAEWWDYARNGRYYITICTENREHYFGKIVKKTVRLSHVGVIADIMWHEIKNHTKNVKSCVYQVRPNHLHGILHLNYPKIENYDLDRGRHVETLHA